jgi:hypothetical protein
MRRFTQLAVVAARGARDGANDTKGTHAAALHNRASQSAFPRALASALLATVVLLAVAAPSAFAGNAGSASNWKAYDLNSSGQALRSRTAPQSGTTIANFAFLAMPSTTSYLLTSWSGYNGSLLGNLSGNDISANYSIDGSSPVFAYRTANNPCGTPASVRLYFQGATKGGFDPAHYWWSNLGSNVLVEGQNQGMTDSLASPQNWTDIYGKSGASPEGAAGFEAAVHDVDSIGVSYGGGCFFANGVGLSSGSADFHLNGYTTTP